MPSIKLETSAVLTKEQEAQGNEEGKKKAPALKPKHKRATQEGRGIL